MPSTGLDLRDSVLNRTDKGSVFGGQPSRQGKGTINSELTSTCEITNLDAHQEGVSSRYDGELSEQSCVCMCGWGAL